jgi:hypothetical protein
LFVAINGVGGPRNCGGQLSTSYKYLLLDFLVPAGAQVEGHWPVGTTPGSVRLVYNETSPQSNYSLQATDGGLSVSSWSDGGMTATFDAQFETVSPVLTLTGQYVADRCQ